jgi:hypothetical protein
MPRRIPGLKLDNFARFERATPAEKHGYIPVFIGKRA